MKTLENKIILSTRPASEDDNIKSLLTGKGATVIDFPMIKTVSKSINNQIIELVSNINDFQWLVFTSKNGVNCFFETYKNYIDPSTIKFCKIAVVGNATAVELHKFGFKANYISRGKNAEKLALELLENQVEINEKVLLVLGELANDELENKLSEFVVTSRIDVYQTISTDSIPVEIIERINKRKYDLILFTSPSTVRNFMNIMKQNQCSTYFVTACIGKTTEREMISLGVIPQLTASEPSADKFVDEIEHYLINKNIKTK